MYVSHVMPQFQYHYPFMIADFTGIPVLDGYQARCFICKVGEFISPIRTKNNEATLDILLHIQDKHIKDPSKEKL